MKRWPLHKAWFWEPAPFFRLLLPLVAAICVYSASSSHINCQSTLVLLATSAMVLIISGLIKQKSALIKYLFAAAVHATVFFLAFALCYYNDIRNDRQWFGHHRSAAFFTARITEQPAEKTRTWKLKVDVLNSFGSSGMQLVKGNAFVYVYKDENDIGYREGDTILLPAKWQSITTAGNPFEFNYAAYCARHNIYYQQFIGSDELVLYTKARPTDIGWIRSFHNWCMHRLEVFIKDKSVLGLLQAMLIGDEANFDDELRQAYSETGIIHVVAISGSHITIFFVLIAFLLSWIKNRKYHWLKYMIAIPLIWVYVLMAGAPPSAVRAAVMFTILGIGFALQKSPNSINQLLATAFILLCAQPMWLFSVGFQLSFLAVLSLVLFYRPVYNLLSPVHFITKALWASVAASVAAEILIAPLVIYYFHIFPLMFIIANIVAYLFMGVVLVVGMLIIGFSYVPVIASSLGSITIWLVAVFNGLVFQLKQFNPESFYFLDLKYYELLLLYLVIITVSIYIFKKYKGAVFVGLTSLCLLIFSFCYNEWLALHQEKLVLYNIGRTNHMELIKGKYYKVVLTDSTISKKTKSYGVKPAHTAWHAWREQSYEGNRELISIGEYSVLILNARPACTDTFPVDYVIINYNTGKPDLEAVQQIFHPKKIILGGNISRLKAVALAETGAWKGITVHNLKQDGAFVLSAF